MNRPLPGLSGRPVGSARLPVVLLFLLVFCTMLRAAEGVEQFDAANRLYEQGKYAEAVTAYRGMIQAGEASPAVYFNLGNAYFKLQRNGEAVASYRLAERLAPRDPDVQANLRFVRDASGIRTGTPVAWWEAWTQRVSMREWATLTGAGIWLLSILGILRIFRPGWNLRSAMLTVGIAAALAGVGLALTWQGQYGGRRAVVKVKEAVVRFGPLDDSQTAFTLSDGAEVLISDTKNGWWEVRDGQGRKGWVKEDVVVRLDDLIKE